VSLARVIRRAQKSELPGQTDYKGEPHDIQRLPAEFGLFIDWVSLCQKDDDGQRTEAERAAFNDALSTMQLWYAHQALFGVVLSAPFSDPKVPAYDARGWPTAEQAWMFLVKSKDVFAWPPILDAGSETGERKRPAPIHPDELEALLEEKRFTSPKADKPMVSKLYRETAMSTLGGAKTCKYIKLGWGDEELRNLAKVLPMYKELRQLNITYNDGITKEGCEVLARALGADATMAPKLKEIVWPWEPQIVSKDELAEWCKPREFKHN